LSAGAPAFPAVLERRGRFLVALPLFARAGPGGSTGQLTVSLARSGAAPGDLVLVSLRPSRRGGRAEIVRRLGRPDIARDVIEALMIDRGLARRFDSAVEREAREAGGGGKERRDLRALATFTIDPASARDFDDAISAERTADGTIRVHVHIADVAAFVAPGSLVDREARRRATSVYVPGAVEPMLPQALSNEKCSLVPGEDRLAVSVELELAGARVVRASFARSLIRSDERLDYDRVDRIFSGREGAAEPWASALEAAREAAAALGAERMRRGGLELEGSEPEFDFDRAGRVRSVHLPEQTESHRLIEHLMIAANEQVAKLLADRGEPALYRVHE
jgi:ribonuclease R